MQIKRFLLALIFLFFLLPIQAYNLLLQVESFALEENALTAKNEPVYDRDNKKCALVIVKGVENENLRFETGGFCKVEEKRVDGERAYLLWVSEGTVRVKISSDSKSFEPIEYYFNPRVKKAETYLMNLRLETLKTSLGKQYLEFIIEPKNASLEVNNELWPLSGGIAYRQLPKGKYQYQIKAKDYHTESGIIDFSDLSAKKSIPINLKPNFGWLSISSEYPNITLYIDDELYNGSYNQIKLSSGVHSIKAAKEQYQTFSQTIQIEDNESKQLYIELKPNFSTVSITVDGGGEIYLDDKLIGKNSWTGNLVPGNYKLDLKKLNYNSFSETISIKEIGKNLNFDYKELRPILGSVSVESAPTRAKVKIDGKDYGTTPLIIPEIIIGGHRIMLKLEDYNSISEVFDVKEGEETNLKYKLSLAPKYGSVRIESNPANANIEIDGINYGVTPMTIPNIVIGQHNLTLSLKGFQSLKHLFQVKGEELLNLNFNLKEEEKILNNLNSSKKAKTQEKTKKELQKEFLDSSNSFSKSKEYLKAAETYDQYISVLDNPSLNDYFVASGKWLNVAATAGDNLNLRKMASEKGLKYIEFVLPTVQDSQRTVVIERKAFLLTAANMYNKPDSKAVTTWLELIKLLESEPFTLSPQNPNNELKSYRNALSLLVQYYKDVDEVMAKKFSDKYRESVNLEY